ncbi:MAG: (2Fe-2S) ferredoxin domain-containing protein [Oscillospiraceae bacterium]|nr:(2Fe-2S) ferredoxin domain-containing protein [Oscillospiraceae bacterium]
MSAKETNGMKVTICIGSCCHVKGSRMVLDQLRTLVRENGIENEVELCGTFCIGKCQQGVCVTVEEELFSLKPDTTADFFENVIKARVMK